MTQPTNSPPTTEKRITVGRTEQDAEIEGAG